MKRAHVPFFVAAGLASAGALVACNAIVGAGDYSVGAGEPPADAATPIDSTSGDDAPAPDTGADGGGDDAQVACGKGLPTGPAFDQQVRACVLWAGCTGKLTNIDISTCISWDWFASNTNDPQLPCLGKATTCAEVTACLGEAWAKPAQCSTSGSSPTGTCQGSLAINCQGGDGTTLDCAKYAGTTQCGVYPLPNDGGTTAACIVKPTCTSDAGSDFVCDPTANTIYECINGVGYGFSCTPAGDQCNTFGGDTDCWIQGPTPCTNAGELTCADPKTLSFCLNTQSKITLHCASAGQTCVTAAGSGNCVSPGCTVAEVASCKESCESNRYAHLCVGGAPLKVDCTSYPDFTGCVVQSNGYATCVP